MCDDRRDYNAIVRIGLRILFVLLFIAISLLWILSEFSPIGGGVTVASRQSGRRIPYGTERIETSSLNTSNGFATRSGRLLWMPSMPRLVDSSEYFSKLDVGEIRPAWIEWIGGKGEIISRGETSEVWDRSHRTNHMLSSNSSYTAETVWVLPFWHLWLALFIIVCAQDLRVLTSPGTLVALYRRRRSVRLLAAARCPSCHYNLTGNQSGVCPECGRAFPLSALPAADVAGIDDIDAAGRAGQAQRLK